MVAPAHRHGSRAPRRTSFPNLSRFPGPGYADLVAPPPTPTRVGSTQTYWRPSAVAKAPEYADLVAPPEPESGTQTWWRPPVFWPLYFQWLTLCPTQTWWRTYADLVAPTPIWHADLVAHPRRLGGAFHADLVAPYIDTEHNRTSQNTFLPNIIRISEQADESNLVVFGRSTPRSGVTSQHPAARPSSRKVGSLIGHAICFVWKGAQSRSGSLLRTFYLSDDKSPTNIHQSAPSGFPRLSPETQERAAPLRGS